MAMATAVLQIRCVVVRRLTPLLPVIGCVVSWATLGAETRRVHRASGAYRRGRSLQCTVALFSFERVYLYDFRGSFYVKRVLVFMQQQSRVMDGECSIEGLRQRLRDMEQLAERQHEELIKKVLCCVQSDDLLMTVAFTCNNSYPTAGPDLRANWAVAQGLHN